MFIVNNDLVNANRTACVDAESLVIGIVRGIYAWQFRIWIVRPIRLVKRQDRRILVEVVCARLKVCWDPRCDRSVFVGSQCTL